MSNFRFELNSDGVVELLQSQEMQAVLQEYADSVLSRLGDGYNNDVYIGQKRANASVFCETKEALKENLENNTLLKALGV